MFVFGSLFVFGTLFTWLTPVWLLSVGVAVGMIVLAAIWGIVYLISRPAAQTALAAAREGILLPIFYVALMLTAFALVGVFLVPGIPYRELVASAERWTTTGGHDYEIPLPATSVAVPLDDVQLRLVELASFTANADQPIILATNVSSGLGQTLALKLKPNDETTWTKPPGQDWNKAPADRTLPDAMTTWVATNPTASPTTLRLHAVTDLEFPELRIVPLAAFSLLAVVLLYLGLRAVLPKVSAIALTTACESMAQPLFYVALGLGTVALLAFIFVPYNTFGEDIKMLKDSGLTLIMVLSIIVAVWSASVSVVRRGRGPHRPDRALQAGRRGSSSSASSWACWGPVRGAVRGAGPAVPDHRLVQSGVRRPRRRQARSRPGNCATWR